MSIVKSFDVGNGDMFYIKHNSDNFTVIDCYLDDNNKDRIISEIQEQSREKRVHRFISTHPDKDHIHGIEHLKEQWGIPNFYCVKNEATKSESTKSFKTYCDLRDSKERAYYIEKGCRRKWMNEGDEQRGSSGISILWPQTSNQHFIKVQQEAKRGNSPNNLSPIIRYRVKNGVSFIWLGDLETPFMEKISSELELRKTNILFAPHHGRDSGKIPKELLEQINPDIIVIGCAPCEHLDYYPDYLTITQNSAGDITFNCEDGRVDISCSNKGYLDILYEKAQHHGIGATLIPNRVAPNYCRFLI